MPKQGVFYQAGHYQILNRRGVKETTLHNCQVTVGKITPKKAGVWTCFANTNVLILSCHCETS